MADKTLTYSKHILDIADKLFTNPTKEVSVIVSEIVSECQKSERTVWRWVKKAQEYNKTRIKKQEKIKDEALAKSTKESIKRDILNREEAEEILSGIAKGNARKIPVKVEVKNGKEIPTLYALEYPSGSERVKAITQLSKMSGWDAAIKNEHTGKDGKPLFSLPDLSNLSDDEIVALYTLLEKTKDSEQ